MPRLIDGLRGCWDRVELLRVGRIDYVAAGMSAYKHPARMQIPMIPAAHSDLIPATIPMLERFSISLDHIRTR